VNSNCRTNVRLVLRNFTHYEKLAVGSSSWSLVCTTNPCTAVFDNIVKCKLINDMIFHNCQ
jgi:hypothetical protein